MKVNAQPRPGPISRAATPMPKKRQVILAPKQAKPARPEVPKSLDGNAKFTWNTLVRLHRLAEGDRRGEGAVYFRQLALWLEGRSPKPLQLLRGLEATVPTTSPNVPRLSRLDRPTMELFMQIYYSHELRYAAEKVRAKKEPVVKVPKLCLAVMVEM